MKKIYSILAGLLLTASVFAQAPQKMSYQAVIRNSSNALITSTPVGMQISILQGSSTGTAVYVETQTASTNANGLVSLEIGSGTPVTGTFAGINWATGPYFIKTETDPTGGTAYTIAGTNELMSVPYALFSANGTPGATGPQGPIGLTGAVGATGATGTNGTNGTNGSSAYQVAVTNGFMGTETQWLASLVGATGATGPQGPISLPGTNGTNGSNGTNGATGATGPQGPAGNDGATGATGPQGPAGNDGAVGATGPQGPAGNDGATGATGPQGPAGNDGTSGTSGLGFSAQTVGQTFVTDCSLVGSNINFYVADYGAFAVGNFINIVDQTSGSTFYYTGRITLIQDGGGFGWEINMDVLDCGGTPISSPSSSWLMELTGSKGATGSAGTIGFIAQTVGQSFVTDCSLVGSNINFYVGNYGAFAVGNFINIVDQTSGSTFYYTGRITLIQDGGGFGWAIHMDVLNCGGTPISSPSSSWLMELTGSMGATGPQGPQGPAGATGFTHYLGEAFDEGIIFYLYKGSDGLEHGLIVALEESIEKWQTTGTLVNANRTEDGVYNTNLMTNSPAKTYIESLGTGWYLPSIDELGLLYYNRYSAQKGLRSGGNTLLSNTAKYWSSTEYYATVAFFFEFYYGSPFTNVKTVINTVRGVRAF